MRPRLAAVLLAVTALLPLAACGAGLITGIASSQGGSPGAEVRPPELSISALLPLVPEANATRTVVVANAQIAASARLRVRIEAAGVAVDQPGPTVAGQGGSTLVTFTLETRAIVAAVADPTAADVTGRLDVLVDDVAIAASAPIVLVRQPRAELVLPPQASQRFLSPLGERVQVRTFGLRSTEVGGLQLLVTTADPSQAPAAGQPWPTITRVCTDLRFESTAPDTVLSAVVPGSTFPVNARLFVRDAIAGESTVATNAFYRPDIALALPSQGPTTGGSLVTLIGTALVPLDLSGTSAPALPDFDDIEISFAKGGRVTTLGAEDFRPAESGTDRLVFTMPASPDGRPGKVDIVLRTRLGAVTAQITAGQLFLFANPKPFFGPRGAVLDREPVAVVPIMLDAEPGTVAAPDFAVLTEQGGVGFLQLLLAQQNGMFQPFAAPRQIGDNEVAAERNPRDICSGDFDGDGVPDMFLANAGAATAVHHLVLGRARPDTPLGSVFRLAGEPGTAYCRAADFDGDGLSDVLLVPGHDSPPGLVPRVRLARPLGPGQPAFAPPIYLPVRALQHDAVEVADLDGDGHMDVVLFRGGSLQLDFAYGNGDGTFVVGQRLDLQLNGYVPDEQSGAVGVHACGNGPLQSVALVLAGLPLAPETPPTLAILPQTAPRNFATTGPVQLLPTEPNGHSLMADVDGQPPLELVLAVAGNPTLASLGLLRFDPGGFLQVPGGVELGSDLPRQIRAIHFARAFPPSATSPEASAVFVVHENIVDGLSERRLSTRLVYVDPNSDFRILVPPDAGARAGVPIEGIVGGNFHTISVAGNGLQLDLALAHSGGVNLIENDGYGGFPLETDQLVWSGLQPRSVTLLPSPPGAFDRLVCANADSRIAVWRHDPDGGQQQSPDAVSGQLRLLSPSAGLQARLLRDSTRIVVGDVDGDGVDDAVVLLSFDVPTPGAADAAIALLRGKAAPQPQEFPFYEPTSLLPVHGNASAIALGDFAAASDGPRELELAVAIPRGTDAGALDGDHVRFFRYHRGPSPNEDRFEPSAVAGGPQVLFAGNGPTQLAAADFDRDGRIDLLVACAADSTLRLFRNVTLPTAGQSEVQIGAFVESLTSPQTLPGGVPTFLHLSDINGDGRLDAVVAVEFTSAQTGMRSTPVAFYLGSAAGEFTGPQFVSPDRVGDRDARLVMDVGDWNRDSVPDLFLGWNTFGDGDRNVRVLFGGTR